MVGFNHHHQAVLVFGCVLFNDETIASIGDITSCIDKQEVSLSCNKWDKAIKKVFPNVHHLLPGTYFFAKMRTHDYRGWMQLHKASKSHWFLELALPSVEWESRQEADINLKKSVSGE